MKLFLFLVVSVLLLSGMSQKPTPKKVVDDWEYNATISMGATKLHKQPRIMMSAMPMAVAPAMKMKSLVQNDKLGFATGGAKDANNFYDNIKNNYLPKLKSITYEGLFYDHYFDTGKQGVCEDLFCPSYATAITQNLFSGQKEYYLSVGLNSNIKASDFKRKKLNLVVVLDISGSMGSAFNRYYYDQKRKPQSKEQEQTQKSKMQIANTSLVNMLKHLHKDDRLGIVLFDNRSYLAKPLHKVADTNMKAIAAHILDLQPRGGTNWSAGYKNGLKLFDSVLEAQKDPKNYENRIIFITDAMPNLGELREDGLFGMVDKASHKGIYTTFIGVGIDFNSDLVERVSKTKGANYYAVHSVDDFKKRLDDEFDFMVTPLVFDLKLSLETKGYAIEAVYGSPQADLSTNTLMYVNTLFPSASKDQKTKGGIIIVKVKKTSDEHNTLRLKASYKDRDNKEHEVTKSAHFKDGFYYENSGIQKGVLLSKYVTLMQNWLLDTRQSCHDKTDSDKVIPLLQRCMLYPPQRPQYLKIKTWERRSCPLTVMQGYQNIFILFARKFQDEMKVLKDSSLQKELDVLKTLSKQKYQPSQSHDDWQTER